MHVLSSTFSAMLLPAVAIENDRKIMVDIMITNLSFIMISAYLRSLNTLLITSKEAFE